MLKRCSQSNGDGVQKKRLRVYKSSYAALYPWMEIFMLHSCQLTRLAPKRRLASLSTTLYRCVAVELASQLRQSIKNQEICLTLAKEEVALWSSQWRAYMVHQWSNTTLPSHEEIDFLRKSPDILGCFDVIWATHEALRVRYRNTHNHLQLVLQMLYRLHQDNKHNKHAGLGAEDFNAVWEVASLKDEMNAITDSLESSMRDSEPDLTKTMMWEKKFCFRFGHLIQAGLLNGLFDSVGTTLMRFERMINADPSENEMADFVGSLNVLDAEFHDIRLMMGVFVEIKCLNKFLTLRALTPLRNTRSGKFKKS